LARPRLLEVCADEVDEILSEFGSYLLFGSIDQMEADVGFEDFAHEAIDPSADRSKEHQLPSAVLVGSQETLDGIELTAEATDSLK